MHKPRRYRESAFNPKVILIAALILLIALVFLLKPSMTGKAAIPIEDKCGRFLNLRSHTIPDESACRTRCRSQCESSGGGYGKAEFAQKDPACNSCMCYCK